MPDVLDLIARIYEAAVLPELWPELLADIAAYGGGEDALIFTVVDGTQNAVVSPRFADHMRDFARDGWVERSDRPARIAAARYPGFITDLDVYSMDEIDRHPVYQEWLIPRGYGWGIGTYVPVPSGEEFFVTVERAWTRGPAGAEEVDLMNHLRPHLARSILVSSRSQLKRARATADALETIGLPACVLNALGRPVAMNARCEALLDIYVRDGRRLTLVDPHAQQLFVDALAAMERDGDHGPRSLPLPARDDHPPAVVHLLPIRRDAREIFDSLSTLVVITLATVQVGNSAPGILEGLFDLSPAEARVAREIAKLATISEIAGRFGSSQETIRTQVKSIFAKTGTRRQAELSALLGALHWLGG